MKYLVIIHSLSAVLVASAITACGGSSDGTDDLIGGLGCVDLSGRWMMNADCFTFEQSQCNDILQTDLYTGKRTQYIADNQPRSYRLSDGTNILERTYFSSTKFVRDQLASTADGTSVKIVRHYYLSGQPCDLVNPDNETYLTMDVYINGKIADDQCKFWARY